MNILNRYSIFIVLVLFILGVLFYLNYTKFSQLSDSYAECEKLFKVNSINSNYMNDICNVYSSKYKAHKNIFMDRKDNKELIVYCYKKESSTVFVSSHLQFMEENRDTKHEIRYSINSNENKRSRIFFGLDRNMLNFYYKVYWDDLLYFFASTPISMLIDNRYYGNVQKCF